MTKTEYSTFTYLVTKLGGDGSTRVETDIVVSSNLVTTTGGVEPTPVLAQQVQAGEIGIWQWLADMEVMFDGIVIVL